MAKYRMIEGNDILIGQYWVIQKKILWWWTECFGEHIYGCTFFKKEEADKWWLKLTNPNSSVERIIKEYQHGN